MQNHREKSLIPIGLGVLCLLSACRQDTAKNNPPSRPATAPTPYEKAVADPMQVFRGTTIDTRFLVPSGYQRIPVEEESFANYLRKLPLKVPGASVTYHDGLPKSNMNLYAAVVDLPIGDKDLHQCADAVMRLRAEHLWLQQRYNEIHFDFTNGMRVDYSEWMKGKRIVVDGNKTSWDNGSNASNSYKDFWEYMEMIFMYAGTLSLSKEMQAVSVMDMQIGDVFIQGGSPGHAVIIVDMAVEQSSGEKVFMLAQSFMPAQELHVIKNRDCEISPWFKIENRTPLRLPEWEFEWGDLKRF